MEAAHSTSKDKVFDCTQQWPWVLYQEVTLLEHCNGLGFMSERKEIMSQVTCTVTRQKLLSSCGQGGEGLAGLGKVTMTWGGGGTHTHSFCAE